jgi:hypothetical protein
MLHANDPALLRRRYTKATISNVLSWRKAAFTAAVLLEPPPLAE